jgi:hypothetical protein
MPILRFEYAFFVVFALCSYSLRTYTSFLSALRTCFFFMYARGTYPCFSAVGDLDKFDGIFNTLLDANLRRNHTANIPYIEIFAASDMERTKSTVFLQQSQRTESIAQLEWLIGVCVVIVVHCAGAAVLLLLRSVFSEVFSVGNLRKQKVV